MSALWVQRCGRWCFLGTLLLLGCSEVRRETNASAAPEKGAAQPTTYSLNATRKSVVHRIGPELRDPEKQKFVQVELNKITNPTKTALLFEVYFQPENGEKVLLGTFSPYPPDNPGRFIVPTKGRLRPKGAIILSLVLPDKPDANTVLEVQVGKIAFREQ